jgi:hypothetical protein
MKISRSWLGLCIVLKPIKAMCWGSLIELFQGEGRIYFYCLKLRNCINKGRRNVIDIKVKEVKGAERNAKALGILPVDFCPIFSSR